jgi:hypothetical protein
LMEGCSTESCIDGTPTPGGRVLPSPPSRQTCLGTPGCRTPPHVMVWRIQRPSAHRSAWHPSDRAVAQHSRQTITRVPSFRATRPPSVGFAVANIPYYPTTGESEGLGSQKGEAEGVGSRKEWEPERVGAGKSGSRKEWEPERVGAGKSGNRKEWEPERVGAGKSGNRKEWEPERVGTGKSGNRKEWEPERVGTGKSGVRSAVFLPGPLAPVRGGEGQGEGSPLSNTPKRSAPPRACCRSGEKRTALMINPAQP